jgi:YD repeat-containing protein
MAQQVDNAGHRTSVTELSGRTVNYGYDNLYRLTSETIAGRVARVFDDFEIAGAPGLVP